MAVLPYGRATLRGIEMKFNILKPKYFQDVNVPNAFTVEFVKVDSITAPTADAALKQAKLNFVAPVLEPANAKS